MNVSDTEMRVLRYVAKYNYVSLGGSGQAAVTAAARRLEKKGLLYKGDKWGVTTAGRKFLAEAEAEAAAEAQPSPVAS